MSVYVLKAGDILFLDRRSPGGEYTEKVVAVQVVQITPLTESLLQLLGMTATKPVVVMSIAPAGMKSPGSAQEVLFPQESK